MVRTWSHRAQFDFTLPWYLESILSNRRNFARTSAGSSGVGAGLGSSSGVDSFSLSAESSASGLSLSISSAGGGSWALEASCRGVADLLGPSSSAIGNSNSVGSGLLVGRVLLLRCRVVLAEGRRPRLDDRAVPS